MITLPTQNDLQKSYLVAAQAEANKRGLEIDISQFSDFQIKGAAFGGVGAGMAQEFNRFFNNVYPQYSDAQGLNLQLANSGVPGIYPATPAILTLSAVGLMNFKSYSIPVDTILTAPNGATYRVISVNGSSTEVILTLGNPTFYAVSVLTGLNTTQANGVVLTLSPPILSTDKTENFSTASVTSSVDGTNEETLANATERLIEIQQTPLAGTRKTDFKYLAIDPANNVTDAVVLINNQLDYTTPPKPYNVGVFDVSGTPITDEILNLGLSTGTSAVVFSRTSSPASIVNTQEKIDNEDIVGVFAVVSTLSTQELTPLVGDNAFFQITVTLQTGFSLSSQIILNGQQFTLEQLIKREARRAVCSQPYGASLSYDVVTGTYTASKFAISAIEQQLDTTLGTATTAGTLGSYLIDRTIKVWNGTTYEYVSSLPLNLGIPEAPTDKLPWIYDISTTAEKIYSNILVETT